MTKPIIAWNIRGLGRSRHTLRHLIQNYNVSIVALFEPFARHDKLQQLTRGLSFDGYYCNEDVGGNFGFYENNRMSLK